MLLTLRTSLRVEVFRWLLLLLTNIWRSRYSTDFSADGDSVSAESWEKQQHANHIINTADYKANLLINNTNYIKLLHLYPEPGELACREIKGQLQDLILQHWRDFLSHSFL